jgi:hypothetical protein
LTPRIALCATLALLGVAVEALVGACSTSNCTETLTCGDAGPREGGADATVDASNDVSSEAGTDGATDALDAPDAPVCACIPPVPAGFLGPVAFIEETPDAGNAAAPPPCVAPYTFEVVSGFNDPIASPASCTCACGSVTGVGCSAVTVQTFSDNTCHNRCGSVLAGTCTASQCAQATQSAIASASTQVGGSCAASVEKGVPTWNAGQDWGVAGRACASSAPVPEAGAPDGGDGGDDGSAQSDGGDGGAAVPDSGEGGSPVTDSGAPDGGDSGSPASDSGAPDGGDSGSPAPDSGCAGTEVCAPFSPFGSSLCVWQSGVVACPASYPNQHLLYASGTDSRSCTPGNCSCPAPTGVSCSVSVTISTEANCSGATVLVGDAGACANYGSVTSPSFVGAHVTHSGGSCTPNGSATANGQITPTGATTVCCGN